MPTNPSALAAARELLPCPAQICGADHLRSHPHLPVCPAHYRPAVAEVLAAAERAKEEAERERDRYSAWLRGLAGTAEDRLRLVVEFLRRWPTARNDDEVTRAASAKVEDLVDRCDAATTALRTAEAHIRELENKLDFETSDYQRMNTQRQEWIVRGQAAEAAIRTLLESADDMIRRLAAQDAVWPIDITAFSENLEAARALVEIETK